MRKTSSKLLFTLLAILACISIAVGIVTVVFIFSTEPEPKFDKASCLYGSTIGFPPSLVETDDGFLIKDFTGSSDDFKVLSKWQIANQNIAWQNTKTGKIVLDRNFFLSVPGDSSIYALVKDETQETVAAILQNTDFTASQLRELVIFLVESGIVSIRYNDNQICLYSEINTNAIYRADFSLIDREYTNTETAYLHDLSLEIDKITGEVVATTTYRGSLVKENIELFGWSRYRSGEQ